MFSKFRQKGFTLVELMIVVAIIGVLAALAIPAFIMYLNRAKASEAETILGNMADGAVQYMEGDQEWSHDDGPEPWHNADDESSTERPGMPVGFGDKTWPGGTSVSFGTAEDIPVGGGQIMPDPVGEEDDLMDATLQALNFNLEEATYFTYSYVTGGDPGGDAELDLGACHTWDGGGDEADGWEECHDDFGHHAIIQECYVDDDDGAHCAPSFTINEFE